MPRHRAGIPPRPHETGAIAGAPAVRAVRRFRLAPAAALLLSLLTILIGLLGNTWTAGGMDSYGYVSQADRWLDGRPATEVPAAAVLPWPNALGTLIPIGYVPGPNGEQTMVPYCPPGLSLLMAGAKLVAGHCAAFWVVPFTGGLLVWACFAIGRAVRSDAVGLVAAAFVATSPTFLFMVTAPMSDVPAAAFWAVAILGAVRGTFPMAALAGLSASIAIVIRPNLMPLAAVLALWMIWQDATRTSWRGRLARGAVFSVGILPGSALIALLNNAWYGSPLQSGQGGLDYLFSAENLGTNLIRYPRWFVETQTPLAAAAAALLLVPWKRVWHTPETSRAAALFGGLLLVALLIHALFAQLEEWWYLRYLLAAWPGIFVGLAILLSRIWERPGVAMKIAGAAVAAAVSFNGLRVAEDRGAFTNAVPERRYPDVAQLVNAHTETGAVILSMQHSGTVRYYAGRQTVRFDWLDEAWLDRAIDWLQAHGLRPYILLEEWERPMFRERFEARNRLGGLAFRQVFVYRNPATPAVYLYDPLGSETTPPEVVTRLPEVPDCVPPAPLEPLRPTSGPAPGVAPAASTAGR